MRIACAMPGVTEIVARPPRPPVRRRRRLRPAGALGLARPLDRRRPVPPRVAAVPPRRPLAGPPPDRRARPLFPHAPERPVRAPPPRQPPPTARHDTLLLA